ncbi:MAG: hypothetical protein AB7P03_28835 [Kofleriaceae bacterium]
MTGALPIAPGGCLGTQDWSSSSAIRGRPGRLSLVTHSMAPRGILLAANLDRRYRPRDRRAVALAHA